MLWPVQPTDAPAWRARGWKTGWRNSGLTLALAIRLGASLPFRRISSDRQADYALVNVIASGTLECSNVKAGGSGGNTCQHKHLVITVSYDEANLMVMGTVQAMFETGESLLRWHGEQRS